MNANVFGSQIHANTFAMPIIHSDAADFSYAHNRLIVDSASIEFFMLISPGIPGLLVGSVLVENSLHTLKPYS
jgi:hypothetical protein